MNSTSRVFEIGELRGEVAGLGDDRAGGRAEVDAKLARDDLRQRRLAEARRADEQHMVERVAARLGGLDEDLEIGARRLLAGEIGKRQRTQRRVGVVVALFGADKARGAWSNGRLPCAGAGAVLRCGKRSRAVNRPSSQYEYMSLDDFEELLARQARRARSGERSAAASCACMVGARWEHKRIIQNLSRRAMNEFRRRGSRLSARSTRRST